MDIHRISRLAYSIINLYILLYFTGAIRLPVHSRNVLTS